MTSAELKSNALPALIAGTNRRPIKLPAQSSAASSAQSSGQVLDAAAPASALKALALTSQALRFELPLPPPSFAIGPHIEDPRRIMPERARRPLIRLLQSRRPMDEAHFALASAFDRLKMRPHPFDLPRIAIFVRTYARLLGAAAEQFIAVSDEGTDPAPASLYQDQPLDDTTWTSASLARRVEYIEDRRRLDPAAARTLVEAAFAQHDADTRVRLLAAFAIGLGPDDGAFLVSLESDRAPRVRALAERLRCRLPGAAGDHPALKACLERIQKTHTGLLRKRPVLKLELPATVKDYAASQWVRETFAEVTWSELSRALDIAEDGMIDAAQDDPHLLLGLAAMATQDVRLDLLQSLVTRHFKQAWEHLSVAGHRGLIGMTPSQREQWAETLAAPYAADPPRSLFAWKWMQSTLEQPMSERLILPLLQSGKWLDEVLSQGAAANEWTILLAACCPSGLRSRLRNRLESIDPSYRVEAGQLMDILDFMESA